MTTTSLADAKNRLSELVSSAETTHERTIITKNGKPVAVLIGVEDLEGLEETLEILSDSQAVAAIREGQEAARRGEFVTEAELRADLAARRPAR